MRVVLNTKPRDAYVGDLRDKNLETLGIQIKDEDIEDGQWTFSTCAANSSFEGKPRSEDL